MRITGITWQPYRLPFAGAFRTARGSLAVREGLILRLETEAGLLGLGEAAPLPEFGGGTVAEAERVLQEWVPTLLGLEPEQLDPVLQPLMAQGGPGVAAAVCGLVTAAVDASCQEAGVPMALYLEPGLHNEAAQTLEPGSLTVPVNATVGLPGLEEAVLAARRAVAEGFSCLKLKVGVAPTFAQEIERVAAVRAALGPGPRLRLDANGGWTVETAIKMLQSLEQFEIELIEQPVAPSDLAGMAQVRRASSIPVAADEAVTGEEAARRVIEMGAADWLVVKPMVVGGPWAGRRIIQLAESFGLRSFVTTTIDSGVGIAAALHLAATLPPPHPYCGLATATLLSGTLVEGLPPVSHGTLTPLWDKPGLGLRLG